jgi:hypothetical protein
MSSKHSSARGFAADPNSSARSGARSTRRAPQRGCSRLCVESEDDRAHFPGYTDTPKRIVVVAKHQTVPA